MNRRRASVRAVLGAFAAWLACAPAVAPAGGDVARGRYLVNTILACGNCHTPKGVDGRPLAERELSGGGLAFNVPSFAGVAPNITPDPETGIGKWSDDDIKRALVEGKRPDRGRVAGQPLGAPMAVNFFKALTPADLDAVVAYLRSVPPIRNPLPSPTYPRPVVRERYPDADAGFTDDDLRHPVRRGAYLATLAHCMECHTPIKDGVAQYDQSLGAGMRLFLPSMVQGLPPTWKGVASRNITSDPELGLGRWSDAEIKRAITQGVRRDGRPLQPPMGFAWYAGLTADDLDALVAWLRTVPPKP